MERTRPFSAQKSANSLEVYWQAAVAVEDHPGGRSSGAQRGVEGLDDQAGA